MALNPESPKPNFLAASDGTPSTSSEPTSAAFRKVSRKRSRPTSSPPQRFLSNCSVRLTDIARDPLASVELTNSYIQLKKELDNMKNKIYELENLLAPLLPLTPLLAPSSRVEYSDLLKATSLIDCLSAELALRFKCQRQVIIYNVPDKFPTESAKQAVLNICSLEQFNCRAKRFRKSSPSMCCPLVLEFDSAHPAQLLLDRQHLLKAHPKLQNARASIAETHLQREAKAISTSNDKTKPSKQGVGILAKSAKPASGQPSTAASSIVHSCPYPDTVKSTGTTNFSTERHDASTEMSLPSAPVTRVNSPSPTEVSTHGAAVSSPSTSCNTVAPRSPSEDITDSKTLEKMAEVVQPNLSVNDSRNSVDMDDASRRLSPNPSSSANDRRNSLHTGRISTAPIIHTVRSQRGILGNPRVTCPTGHRKPNKPSIYAVKSGRRDKLLKSLPTSLSTAVGKTRLSENLQNFLPKPPNSYNLTRPSNNVAPFRVGPFQTRPPPAYRRSPHKVKFPQQWAARSRPIAPGMQIVSLALQLLSLVCPQNPALF